MHELYELAKKAASLVQETPFCVEVLLLFMMRDGTEQLRVIR